MTGKAELCFCKMQVLEQYANIEHRDQLRCNAAFFMGLLKQVMEKKQAVPVVTVRKPGPADSAKVSLKAEQKLDELCSQGLLNAALMDQHCMGLLAALPKATQLSAVASIAANVGEAQNKHGYITQLLKNMRASAVSLVGRVSKPASQQHANLGGIAPGGKVVSNTGKLINPNEVSIRLNPSSIFYDAELAMCWRVLTKQDKYDWQSRLAKGKQVKLSSLSKPRQKLAHQLHPGHVQYDAATASAWKHSDALLKEELLLSADATGELIQLIPSEPQPIAATELEFHEIDFPLLGGSTSLQPKQAAACMPKQGNAMLESASESSSLQTDPNTEKCSSRVARDCPASTLPGSSNPVQDKHSESQPLYNMGMAFQQSLSLQDINKSDPRRSSSTNSLASVSVKVSSSGSMQCLVSCLTLCCDCTKGCEPVSKSIVC